MNEFISHTSWMRDIPDDTPVTTVNIPGTHNSCCVDGLLGLAKTQNLDLSDQLNAGIRFLDIRLTHYRDNLCVHHDVFCTEKSYSDVLAICSSFLGQHPSETILMAVKEEDRLDSGLGKFAPSQAFCKLPIVGDCDENSGSFEKAFKAKTWECIEGTPLFYNFTTAPPDGDSVATSSALTSETSSALTSETRLGELRGKIVLLRRFEGGQGVGADFTYWPENQRFRSAAPPFYDVEDRYQNPADDEKFNLVATHIEDARRGDPKDLYITFSSAVALTASDYARTMNPRLSDYLAESSQGRIGIIVMDYFEEPQELVSNVIKTNFATGTPGNHPTQQTV